MQKEMDKISCERGIFVLVRHLSVRVPDAVMWPVDERDDYTFHAHISVLLLNASSNLRDFILGLCISVLARNASVDVLCFRWCWWSIFFFCIFPFFGVFFLFVSFHIGMCSVQFLFKIVCICLFYRLASTNKTENLTEYFAKMKFFKKPFFFFLGFKQLN